VKFQWRVRHHAIFCVANQTPGSLSSPNLSHEMLICCSSCGVGNPSLFCVANQTPRPSFIIVLANITIAVPAAG
jgi:hypothetical protein